MLAKTNHYQDFMLTDLKSRSWFRRVVRPSRKFGQFHTTKVRRSANNQLEITFEIPIPVKEQMRSAILAGKQIRLFIPGGKK